MVTIPVLDADGKKVGARDLAPEIFEAKVNVPLMHQVVVAGLASLRSGTHSTKTRGEVSGGGKKPWRQKGTGRARQGSNRAPQWTGGGVVHGPKPRDHEVFGRVLLVLKLPTDGPVERSFRNLPNVKLAYASSLGTYDVIVADRVLFTKAALDVVESREGSEAGGEGGGDR
jgi:large subunit ribosomal protein L4